MALGMRMDMRQGQSLVMTPQLQQAIKLLQMSNIDLQAFVDSELESNPLLERDEKQDTERREAEKPVETIVADDTVSSLAQDMSQEDRVQTLDTDLDNVYADEAKADSDSRSAAGSSDNLWSDTKSGSGLSLDNDDYDFAATLTRKATLAEHLTDQLNIQSMSEADKLIGHQLIGMVNEAGYLTADIASIAEAMGTEPAHVERVLAAVQNFDPAGCFAKDLADCLALQLKELDRFDPAMATLLANLPLVAKRDFQTLKNLCKVDMDDIRDMVLELRKLNPKPGHAFGSDPVMPVVPDVFVRAARDGSWAVELNNDTLPKVLVNNQYSVNVARGAKATQDKQFMAEAHANATWLVKSLDQRAKTILKVAREIVTQQDAFLVLGVQHLRPISLKTVAEAIEMHESTVSRVTSNKYMSTPRGTFELKYFFTTAIASSNTDGDSHSSESVRHRIKEMIDAETPDAVLSDDTIVTMLQKDGVEIARRTVAKYRESLGLASSVQRRRETKVKL